MQKVGMVLISASLWNQMISRSHLEHLNGPIYLEVMSRTYGDAQTEADRQLKPKGADTNLAMVGRHNEL